MSWLREEFDKYKQSEEEIAKLEPLAATSLHYEDAISIFNQGTGQSWVPWRLEQHELQDVPNSLVQYLKEIDYVSDGKNEDRARMKVDAILIESLCEEKRFALGVHTYDQDHRSDVPAPASGPSTLVATTSDARPVQAPLMLKPDVELHRVVTYKHERRLLKGSSDYTLHYDAKDPHGTNLVIIVAKRRGAEGLVEGQLVAYMGMVHEARKEKGKRDITVFGVATDGENFRYYRYDNNSQLARSPPFDWISHEHQKEILSRLRLIIRAAIVSSPSPIPIKEGQPREAMLTKFDEPVTTGRFDFLVREADWDVCSEDMEMIGDT